VANMRALCESSPRLAVQIDAVDELDLLSCQETRSGAVTCQLPGSAGTAVYVHSRYDPVREAERWADGVEDLAAQQESKDGWQAPMCYVVDGFGLGYHVKALYDRLAGEAFIVVSERNTALLRTALQTFDHSEMLASDRLAIITTADRQEIFKKLQQYSNAMMMGVVFTHALQRIDADFHAQVHTLVAEYASYLRSHLISLLHNGIITCENILRNLPTYVATPGIDILKNRFRGHPAVIVSAGPSLRRNIEQLGQIRDRVVVIAVQTTLKPLLAYGIVPDFVTSLDYHPVSERFFEGLTAEQLRDIHLIAEPKATPGVIDYYHRRGPVSLLGNEFAQLVLGDAANEHDELTPGATVAHLAFYLAEYLGADPIVFIGQDLGFTDNVYYSPGTALHAVWRPELNRFCSIEMKEWERIVRHRGLLRKVKDIHDQPIYTDEQMFTYLQQFEKDFARCTATVIDASEAGARKQNCTTMTLGDVAAEHCRAAIDRDKFSYRQHITTCEPDKLCQARGQVEKRIEEVRQFCDVVQETLGLINEMLELLDDQPTLNKKMVRLDELRTMVKHRPNEYRLVMYVSQAAEIFRFRQDRIIELDSPEGKKRQRRQLQRDVAYIGEIDKGCERLLKMLEDCLTRLDEAIAENGTGKE